MRKKIFIYFFGCLLDFSESNFELNGDSIHHHQTSKTHEASNKFVLAEHIHSEVDLYLDKVKEESEQMSCHMKAEHETDEERNEDEQQIPSTIHQADSSTGHNHYQVLKSSSFIAKETVLKVFTGCLLSEKPTLSKHSFEVFF